MQPIANMECFTPAAATPHPAAPTKHDELGRVACFTKAGLRTEVTVAPGETVLTGTGVG